MNPLLPGPLLADDIGNWIGLVILVLSVLGWIVNAIKGVDAQGKPLPQRKPAKPNRDLRSEIDVFLEELQQPKPLKPEPPRPAPEPVMATRKADRPRKDKSRKANQVRQDTTPNKVAPKTLASSFPAMHSPRFGVQEHVSAFNSSSSVAADVKRTMADRVGASVQQHLSGGTVAPITDVGTTVPREPHPLVALLSKPEGLRQAVLLNEILQRPRSLRTEPR